MARTKHQRKAMARKLLSLLPERQSKDGETVVKDKLILRAIRELKR